MTEISYSNFPQLAIGNGIINACVLPSSSNIRWRTLVEPAYYLFYDSALQRFAEGFTKRNLGKTCQLLAI